MDYSALSDLDINKRVALRCNIEGVVINSDGEPVRNTIDESPGSYSGGDYIEVDYDPCNNPADAWPIILENRIAIIPDSAAGEWVAFNEFTLYEGDWMFSSDPATHANGKNPLRAAMVVFLMMQGK